MAIAALVAGCAPTSTSGVQQNTKSTITVWVDDARLTGAKEWAAQQTKYKYDIESVDGITQKVSLAVKAGKGVPDVVFLGEPNEISTLLVNPTAYPLALNDVISKSTLNSFSSGTTERCTYEGKTYCLPNDIAQTVLFYNKDLFAQFGYTVPTTFDQWKELGAKVAAEHPGYSLGSVNGRYALDAYYQSSGCQIADVKNATQVTIDASDEKCTRVNDVIGPMLANGSLSAVDPFDATYTAKVVKEDKLLAEIGPSWLALYGIQPNTASGQWSAAAMPRWSGASSNPSGAVGGGIWVAYKNTPNKAGVAALLTAVTTNQKIIAGTEATPAATYPANTAAAKTWLSYLSTNSWYAEDPSSVLEAAAGKIDGSAGYVRYRASELDAFNQTVIVDGGKDISSAWSSFSDKITSAAKASGYTVSK